MIKCNRRWGYMPQSSWINLLHVYYLARFRKRVIRSRMQQPHNHKRLSMDTPCKKMHKSRKENPNKIKMRIIDSRKYSMKASNKTTTTTTTYPRKKDRNTPVAGTTRSNNKHKQTHLLFAPFSTTSRVNSFRLTGQN